MQARTLLALVACRPRAVADSELIEVCWSSNPVATALNSVRNTVARLRQDLGSDSIVRHGDGYALGPAVGLDLDDFEAIVDQAMAMHRANDTPGARACIDLALALVRGEPFEDVAHETWAMPAVTYWSERVAVAEDLYIELADAAMDVAATPRMRELARERPEREKRWLALARSLNRSGRRVDALRTLNEARRELAEFGLEPGPELSAVELVALSGADVTSSRPADRRRSGHALLGRNTLLHQVEATLSATTALTLTGVGGVGKTRLALELARQTRRENGAAIVDLTHAGDDVDVVRQIAAAADIRLESSTSKDELDRLADVLASLPTLIVIDNAEHHLLQVRDAVDALAGRVGDSRFIVTSRWPVGFVGEVVINVPPLALPADHDSRGGVLESPAVELFFNHAHFVEPDENTDRVVADIVRAVGGNAFAIQLCASLTDTLPVEEVRNGLVRSGRLLDLASAGARTGVTLRSVFDDVVDRLAPEDRNVFAGFGGFHSAFTLPSAQAIIEPDRSRAPLVQAVSRLVRASLVQVRSGDPTTYYLDDLQASFARELLEQYGDTERVNVRVDAHYVGLAATLAPSLRGPDQRQTIALINAEIGNIRHILDRTNNPLSPLDASILAGSLAEYWFLTGQWSEGTRYIDAAIERSPNDRSIARAIALGFRHRVGGMWASVLQSEKQMREAIAIAEALGREDIVNEVAAFAGVAQMARGDLEAGWSAVHRVAKSVSTTPWAAAQARMLLGMTSAIVGNLDRARDECTISVNSMLALGDELNAATTLKNLGLMLQRHGDGIDARGYLERSIQMSDGVMPGVEAQARCALAEIDAEEGAINEAELHVLRSQLRKLGDLSGLTRANRVLAHALLARGEVETALSTLQDSLLYLVDHEEQALGLVLLDIAEIKRQRHCEAEARILVRAATVLAGGTGYGWSANDRARIGAIPRQRATTGDEELSLIQRAVSLALSV